ncbi:hypothetical protein BKA61DRAFT_599606 [Leptodontidium sp. MPI-SDFR-AT-0119]|nr:hypothetical protein BKA61DRAFT_599606 [Leptodontidium sp. MPI-SDFR-AT-0119]
MPYPIQTVAVAGATGNTGPTVIRTLIASGFKVTALTRSAAKTTAALGPEAKVIEVDYLSQDSLVSALQGIDAVVVCGVGMLPEQTNLIAASITSGVTRFLPSSFATPLNTPGKRTLRIHRDKLFTSSYLQARTSLISHTIIHTGPLLDYLLNIGVLVNLKSRTITLFDDGEKRFSTTTMATASAAVAAVLKMGEGSANREFCVHDVVTCQNELLELAKEVVLASTGSGSESGNAQEWTVARMDTGECERKAEEAFRVDGDSAMGMHLQKVVGVFGKAFTSDFGEADNRELGIEMMDRKQLKEVLGRFA